MVYTRAVEVAKFESGARIKKKKMADAIRRLELFNFGNNYSNFILL